MTELPGVWEHARYMVESGWSVIPLRERDKRPIWDEWPKKGVATSEGVEQLAANIRSTTTACFAMALQF